MDPLTVALAVVSLATAVKDMVELAQKIHKSFAKVSNNLHKAQHVAKDIAEMVEKINVFYTIHQATLDNTESFRVALLSLLGKFKDFEASILPLLPKTGGKKLGRFIRGWWNNNKIEERILDLQSNIVRVLMEYMVDSAMRGEVKLETIHQDTSKGLAGITQGLEVLEVVHRDISALRITTLPTVQNHSYGSLGTTSDELNRNVTRFAQSRISTSAPMLRTPEVITEEVMTTAYIKLQLNNIARVIENMTILPASGATNIEFRLSKIFEQPSMSIMHLRHDVVRQVTTIRDHLDAERIPTVSIYDGARTLNELAVGLQQLSMHDESVLVGNWAIKLARTLIDVSGNEQRSPVAFLAIYLVNQSAAYSHIDRAQGLRLIKEAYTITQNLRSEHPGEVPFQILYSDVLLQYAELMDDRTRSITMSIEGIHVLEDVFNVQAFTQPNSHKTFNIQVKPSSSFLDNLFSSAPTAFSIVIYALSLGRLATYLFEHGLRESARDLMLLEIAVLRRMVSVYGPVHRVQLAVALSVLVRDGIGGTFPNEELIDMIDECTQLLRELAEQNPLNHARPLVGVLWKKAYVLENLNRDADAIATWQEAAKLAEQIVQDSRLSAIMLDSLSDHFRRLKRHDDAARTRALAIAANPHDADCDLAWQYSCLSDDFQRLRHYKEAAEAAQTCVTHYRRYAMIHPRLDGTHYLTERLSKLAQCMAVLGKYSDALIAWEESVNMVDNFLNNNSDKEFYGSIQYLAALRIHVSISYVLEDEEECLKVCATAVRSLRQLSEVGALKGLEGAVPSLLAAEFCHAYTNFRFGRPQAARQYIDHWIDAYSGKYLAIPKSETTEWHTSMIILKAHILDAQGYTQQALLAGKKAHAIVRPYIKTHQPLFEKAVDSMVQQARLQVNLGSSDEALRVAEGALRLSRDNKLDPAIGTLVLSLHEVAFVALSFWDYKRAAEAAREGCNILISPEGLNLWETSEQNIPKRASLYAILSSAEANLGNRSTAIEYAYRAVDVSQEIKERKADISATTAERSYMETRGNLADILLATGHLAQAWEICKERRDYFSKRVDKWMGDYRELAPILRILGILSCSEGRHEEGEAAAEELSRIMVTLGNAFPSLQEQVKIRLRNQAKVPILKVLDDMSAKLDCEHQAGVVSLFKV